MGKAIIFFILLACCVNVARAQLQTISQAEYFIGTDPGEGNGHPLTIPKGNAVVDTAAWHQAGLPQLRYGEVIYVRIKSSGFPKHSDGSTVQGAWSFPTPVIFPTTAVLLNAQAKIVRPTLQYPLLENWNIFPLSGSYDSSVQQLRVKIPADSLLPGDTLEVRLQGKDELWGDWSHIPITQDLFAGVTDNSASSNASLDIYPNPAQNEFTIRLTNYPSGLVHYEISDALGRTVEHGDMASSTLPLSTRDLPAGVFTFRVVANGSAASRQFVVAK